jgi:hypothetical protein
MLGTVATAVIGTFAGLSLIHFYWALGGRFGKSAAIPQISDRPAFVPSAFATFAVAVGLSVCGLLVAAAAGFIASPLSATWSKWACYAFAAGLLARAVGDFRLVGFFKRIRAACLLGSTRSYTRRYACCFRWASSLWPHPNGV